MEKKRKVIVRRNTSNKIFREHTDSLSLSSKLFYGWLVKKQDEKDIALSLKELSQILMAPNGSYTYSFLRLKVLNSIQNDLSQAGTPLNFSYFAINDDFINIKIFNQK